MKIALLILAHKHPQQLKRLIMASRHPSLDFWVHIDSKSQFDDFKEIFELENVFKVQSTKVDWGCFNTIECMLNSLNAASKTDEKYDYYQFLSGMDYPIKPIQLLVDHLQQNNGYEFIGNRPLEESLQNLKRFNFYNFNKIKQPFRRICEKLANTFLPRRKFSVLFEIRKGPQWMTLSNAAVKYLLEFTQSNKKIIRYFRYVEVPDEFFFQTILYNSPFRATMKNHIFHYIDWSEQKKNPKILTVEDKEKLFDSPLFFARKFDVSIDATILDAIDERIRKMQALYTILQ